MDEQERIKGLKQVAIMCVIVIVILFAVLAFNYVELNKLKEITGGTYVEIGVAQEMCDQRCGGLVVDEKMFVEINFTGQ